VTGPDGLRAFSSSELLGDSGLFAQLAFGFPIAAKNGFNITGSAFVEYGRVSGGDINSQVTTRSLSDYGVEMQLNKGDWFFSTCAAFGSSQATVAEPAKSYKLTLKASKHF
jgi:hemolysin activation/secretion protein